LGEVQKVLQQLLREQVSIRDLGTILEALVEAAAINKNPVSLVEAARHSLGRALIRPLLNDKRPTEGGDAGSRDRRGVRAQHQCNRSELCGNQDK
jgi:hypothetical protein